jgi:hypothetical protein
MAAIKASVNLFALLDGEDPGDKRLADFDPQFSNDQPKQKPVSAAAGDYKLKLMKPRSAPAPAARSKAPRKIPTPAVPASLQSAAAAPRRNPTPAVAAGLRSTAPASMARSMNKQTTAPAPPPARSTNLTGVLFAYPSARERIFKERQERQEEYERRQAELAEKDGSVSGDNDGRSADAGAPSVVKGTGKTHGVRVHKGGGGAKHQPVVPVKQAPAPSAKVAAVAPAVLQTPPPPPSVDDIVQFPSLK